MPENLQEPKSYEVKNGLESGSWDETQLAIPFLAFVFGLFTSLLVIDNDTVKILWVTFVVGLSFIMTLKSTGNSNMRVWQVFYTYITAPRGKYNFKNNKKLE